VYKKFDEDQKDYITERVVEPIEIYYEKGRQYLKAFCRLRSQKRNFRISRITKIELR
jgi:predicted DNA-binding transcriptional regulator YafY